MTDTIIDSSAARALERVLRDKAWLDPRWDEAARRFATALADALRATPPGASADAWIAAAYTSARADAPDAPAAHGETWARVTLALVARDVAREAAREADARPAVAAALTRVAVDVSAATHALAPREAAGVFKLHAVDRVVSLSRKALVETRNRTLPGHPAWGFVVACFDQVSHALTLFMAREGAGADVVRDALVRADETARRNKVQGWLAAPVTVRRAIVRHCLLEAAGAIALAAPSSVTSMPESKDAALWLLRTAGQIAACTARVDGWFPARDNEHDAPPEAVAAAAPNDEAAMTTHTKKFTPPAGGAEAPMKDTTQSIVKTLQVDATDAAWRTAGSQFVKLAREPLVGLLSRHLGPEDATLRAKIAAFLETEVGTALLSALLSAGLSALPAMGTSDVPQRLARELRVRAMADTGDLVADVLMGPLRQVMALYLQDPGGLAVAASAPPALADSTGRVASANVVAMPEREASRS